MHSTVYTHKTVERNMCYEEMKVMNFINKFKRFSLHNISIFINLCSTFFISYCVHMLTSFIHLWQPFLPKFYLRIMAININIKYF